RIVVGGEHDARVVHRVGHDVVLDGVAVAAVHGDAVGPPGQLDGVVAEVVVVADVHGGVLDVLAGPHGQGVVTGVAEGRVEDGRVAGAVGEVDAVGVRVADPHAGELQPVARPPQLGDVRVVPAYPDADVGVLDPHVADPGVPAEPAVEADAPFRVAVPAPDRAGAEDGQVGDPRVVVDVEAEVPLVRVVDAAGLVGRGEGVQLGVPHARAADGDVPDADLVELPAVQRVVGEDLLLLAPLPGRDPHAGDLALLVGGDRPLEGVGVVDAVVGDSTVLGDGDTSGRLVLGRGDLLQ